METARERKRCILVRDGDQQDTTADAKAQDLPPLELTNTEAFLLLQRSIAARAVFMGFDNMDRNDLHLLSDLVGAFMTNIIRSVGRLADDFPDRVSLLEAVDTSLFENGLGGLETLLRGMDRTREFSSRLEEAVKQLEREIT